MRYLVCGTGPVGCNILTLLSQEQFKEGDTIVLDPRYQGSPRKMEDISIPFTIRDFDLPFDLPDMYTPKEVHTPKTIGSVQTKSQGLKRINRVRSNC